MMKAKEKEPRMKKYVSELVIVSIFFSALARTEELSGPEKKF